MMEEEEKFLWKEIFFKTERTCFSWNGKDVSLVTDLYMWQNYGENTVRKIT